MRVRVVSSGPPDEAALAAVGEIFLAAMGRIVAGAAPVPLRPHPETQKDGLHPMETVEATHPEEGAGDGAAYPLAEA